MKFATAMGSRELYPPKFQSNQARDPSQDAHLKFRLIVSRYLLDSIKFADIINCQALCGSHRNVCSFR